MPSAPAAPSGAAFLFALALLAAAAAPAAASRPSIGHNADALAVPAAAQAPAAALRPRSGLGNVAELAAPADPAAARGAEAALLDEQLAPGRAAAQAHAAHAALPAEARRGLLAAVSIVLAQAKPGCDRDLLSEVPEEAKGTVMELRDGRACYPHLEAACPNLEALKEHLMESDMVQNEVGNSASKVLQAPGWEHEYIVKSVKAQEVAPILKVMRKLGGSVTRRAKEANASDASLITPACILATLRYEEQPESWIVLRRIRLDLEEHRAFKVPEGTHASFYDLKGPAWVKGDWKTRFNALLDWSGTGKWRVKDRGFRKAFPRGLDLVCPEACGQFNRALAADAELLRTAKITDYSLLINLHPGELPHGLCVLHNFPLTVEVRDPSTGGHMIMTMGIIDYAETEVAAAWKLGSTMVAPDKYKRKFLDMLGKGEQAYFHCP